jgi:hypothetical protein
LAKFDRIFCSEFSLPLSPSSCGKDHPHNYDGLPIPRQIKALNVVQFTDGQKINDLEALHDADHPLFDCIISCKKI